MRSKKLPSPLPIIVVALIVAWLLRSFVLDLYIVRGDSMVPSAQDGNMALILRCAYGVPNFAAVGYLWLWQEPLPGDLVVAYTNEGKGLSAVKRVFDVGPAYLRMERGVLYARGGELRLGGAAVGSLSQPYYLEPGTAFLVGDNAGFSYDSRNYGAIPIENIRGKVLLFIPNPLQVMGLWRR
jgi:signal peptidase I